MEKWMPISKIEIYNEILISEKEMDQEIYKFWKLISIIPEKWQEEKYGNEGGGFWSVAIFGNRVIWYNDIEDGFNISEYKLYGQIDKYLCNQDNLNETLEQLFNSNCI